MQYYDLLKVSDDGKGLTVKGHPCEVSENISILTLDIHYAMDVSVRLNCSTNFDASKIVKYLVNLDTNLRPYKSPLHSDIIGGMAWAMMNAGFDTLNPSYVPYIQYEVSAGDDHDGATLVYGWKDKECNFNMWLGVEKWLRVKFPHSLKVSVAKIAKYAREAFAE